MTAIVLIALVVAMLLCLLGVYVLARAPGPEGFMFGAICVLLGVIFGVVGFIKVASGA